MRTAGASGPRDMEGKVLGRGAVGAESVARGFRDRPEKQAGGKYVRREFCVRVRFLPPKLNFYRPRLCESEKRSYFCSRFRPKFSTAKAIFTSRFLDISKKSLHLQPEVRTCTEQIADVAQLARAADL